jgi:flavin reductase (DIM6/NTAB) family NADH-FMN oxidoreductase RutF
MPSAAPQATVPCPVARIWPRAEPAAFNAGLARLATATAIVACNGADGPRGLLVTSISTVSTIPPRLLFSIDKAARVHKTLLTAQSVSISLLSADQREVAAAFSAETPDGFDAQSWRLNPLTPPELPDALASFAGPVRCRIDAGVATLFVIDVSTARSRQGAPLVHLDGDLLTAG